MIVRFRRRARCGSRIVIVHQLRQHRCLLAARAGHWLDQHLLWVCSVRGLALSTCGHLDMSCAHACILQQHRTRTVWTSAGRAYAVNHGYKMSLCRLTQLVVCYFRASHFVRSVSHCHDQSRWPQTATRTDLRREAQTMVLLVL